MVTAPDTEPRRPGRRLPRRPPGSRLPGRQAGRSGRAPGQPVRRLADGLFSTRPPSGGQLPGPPPLSPLEEPLPEDLEGADEEREVEDRDRAEEPRRRRDGEAEQQQPEERPEREPPERRASETKAPEGPAGETPERPLGPRPPSGPAAGQTGAEAEIASTTGTAAGTGGVTTTSTGAAGGTGAAATAGTAAGGAVTTGAAAATTTAATGTVTTVAAGAPAIVTAGIPIVIIVVAVLLLIIIIIFFLSFAGEGLGGRTTGIPGDGQRERDLAVTNGEILDQTILGRGSGAQGTFKPPSTKRERVARHPNTSYALRARPNEILKAIERCGDGGINQAIVDILGDLLDAGYKLRITALGSQSHHNSGCGSHWGGRGVDIDLINGTKIDPPPHSNNWRKPIFQEVITKVEQYSTVTQIGVPRGKRAGTKEFNDSNGHIHISAGPHAR